MEGDGLNPSKIYCLSVTNVNTRKSFTTTSYNDIRKFFKKAEVFICHNAKRFDVVVLEKLLEIKITCKVIDSLALSWYLYPTRNKHGLEEWGEYYGVPKPVIKNWENLPLEDYIHRCEEDVKINLKLWDDMFQYLYSLYGSQQEVWRFLDYLSFKMDCAVLQEKSGWKVDVKYLDKAIQELSDLKEIKLQELTQAMPLVPIKKIKNKPKRFINNDGSYSKLGQEWIKFLTDNNLPIDHEEPVEYISGYIEGNPNSPEQIKSWLFSLGWRPITFDYKKNKDTGEIREIPQINLDFGKGICDSIKALYSKEPKLEALDGLSVISHRLGVLNSIKSSLDENNCTRAQIKGLTNTLRYKHTTVVNLPKVDKAYGEAARGCLVARKGYLLCGSDMSSLEDRIKQHFIYFYDPDYVNSMNEEGYDPHLVIAVIATMLTEEQADAYKNGDKTHKPIRDIAKNGNYACQYGAGVKRLMITCGIDELAAKKLFDAYWKLNWAVKQTAEDQTVKVVGDQMWLLNPINRFWYSLRFKKDIFSTLVQGTASYVFDMWLKNVLDKRPQLTAQFHDEFILEIKEGFEDKCTELINYAIDKLNDEVKLNKVLEVNTQFGRRYSHIH